MVRQSKQRSYLRLGFESAMSRKKANYGATMIAETRPENPEINLGPQEQARLHSETRAILRAQECSSIVEGNRAATAHAYRTSRN